ncbi:hypothetical protein [Candidatus Parabeggiatoa sp. HSG14]|uniref:hypothetical protein n=1 Tax=Candidatus Parabeggiatoa sp. HSG14 TaxID=3055593 RepID=UPI0025A8437B|nr:hypothetical protein [Thiotrichales bacterium HSG14]
MNTEIELKLIKEIEELKRKVNRLEGKDENKIPTYQYSKIRDIDLKKLFDIEKNLDDSIFDEWLNNKIEIDNSIEIFLKSLIKDNKSLIDSYSEEDLKVNFIIPILNKVRFKSFEKKIRDFYELQISYKTSQFKLSGTVDFVVSEGLVESKKLYFFIQEFKRSEEYGNPRPQLLAELISAVELNDWKFIKGAYIIAGIWHFVILERLDIGKYQYYISQYFDSTRISDLKLIYKNLLFVKNEIISMVEETN